MLSSLARFSFVLSCLGTLSIPALADPSGTSRDARPVNVALREPEQQTIIVKAAVEPAPPEPEEPPPGEPELPPPAPRRPILPVHRYGRWVFEIGAFGGYMSANMDWVRPDGGESRLSLASLTPGAPGSDCGYEICSYSLGRKGGFVGGLHAFVGFAASERVHVGGRVLAGPRPNGGSVFATGPSVSLHVGGPLWAGASMLVGVASLSDRGYVTPPSGFTLVDANATTLSGSTDAAFGLGLEMRVELFQTTHGAFSIDTHPFFLAGDGGTALVLPLGVSYRFR